MANMFSGNQEKKIPRDLRECYQTDEVTNNLWVWCERLELWGKILFWIIIIGGIALAINSSIIEETKVSSYYGSIIKSEEFDIRIFIPLLLEVVLYAFIEYCTYHIIALLIGALANIVQHTKITANVTLYTAAKEEGYSDKGDQPQSYAISHSSFGEKEKNSVLCDCGYRYYGEICPNCGRKKSSSSSQKQKIAYDNSARKAIQCECGEIYYGIHCPVCGRKNDN